MSPFLIASFIALGAGAWIYVRLQQRTGYGNARSAWTGTIIAAVIIFFVVYVAVRSFL